ncbi:MAG TPA: hypothetical protein VMV29_17810 [Ktedonobacterales bacterium]|nr:hypothetical protein [Ktedonobacterales bacterium]
MRLHLALAARYALVVLGAALLAFEGYNSVGLGVGVAGVGAIRMALDTALGLAALLVASLPLRAPDGWRRAYRRLRGLAVAATLALAILSSLALIGVAYDALLVAPSHVYVTDVVAFSDENARLTLNGQNPYDPATSRAAFAHTLRRFPGVTPSPLRRGAFGTGEAYPSHARIVAVERAYLHWQATQPTQAPDPTGGAFDPATTHSYPALSFLLYAPLIWAGAPGILPLHLAVYLALLVWLIAQAPPSARFWTALVALAALPLTLFSLLADAEVICLAFVLLAWHYRQPRWISAVALGLGCAFKQYCWLFAPFILLDAWITYGWREALRRAGLTLAVFLAPNLPYIILTPGPWFSSLWLPIAEPLFPHGMGLVALTTGGLLPDAPTSLYGALTALALLGALVAFARWHGTLREAALLLALLPLYFALRSQPNYFSIAPWLALYAANRVYARVKTGAVSS